MPDHPTVWVSRGQEAQQRDAPGWTRLGLERPGVPWASSAGLLETGAAGLAPLGSPGPSFPPVLGVKLPRGGAEGRGR